MFLRAQHGRICTHLHLYGTPDFSRLTEEANIRWVAQSLLPGSEPLSHRGGDGGVLVLHGFTGTPQSMRPLAQRFVDASFSVEMPLLPGHGTRIEDLVPMRFSDWRKAAEDAYLRLAGVTKRVIVAGLSMGGSLACRLAADHPEIAGLVLINPFIEPPADGFREILRATLASGMEIAPAVGSDIAKPTVSELSYPGSPLAAALSLFEGLDDLVDDLDRIACPVLLLSSREDHVVPVSTGDFLMERLRVPVTRTWLEHSFHVATLDYDAGIIESAALAFAQEMTKMTKGAAPAVRGAEMSGDASTAVTAQAAEAAEAAEVVASAGAARLTTEPDVRDGSDAGPSPAGERPRGLATGTITIDEDTHVARLARLSLSDMELEQFTGQLAAVLEHAADMARLDISATAPTSHPLPVQNVMRDDEPRPALERDEVLGQAPRVEDYRFWVPRILAEGQ